jgi:peptide/nickel transport system permease protein
MTISRDLFRFSPSFRYGAILLAFVLLLLILSFFSPYEPDERRVVPRNEPPSREYYLGTTALGQDVFWLLTFAVRNTDCGRNRRAD